MTVDNKPVDKTRLLKVDALTSNKTIDFHGRKIINAGAVASENGYTTLSDIRKFITAFLKAPVTFLSSVFIKSQLPKRPLKLDGNRMVVSGTIDITSIDDVSGAVATQILYGAPNGAITSSNLFIWSGTQLLVGTSLGWTSALAQFSTGTADENFAISGPVTLSDGICLHSYEDGASPTVNKGFEIRGSEILIGDGSAAIGFFGGTPIVQQVLASYTPDDESTAYLGIDNLQVGNVYATLAALNSLRIAYENLRLAFQDLRTKIVDSTLLDV